MSRLRPARVASVRVDLPETAGDAGIPHRLAVALLAGSPRVSEVAADWCRVDARGWGRRGGEQALSDVLRRSAEAAGFAGVHVGIADSAVTADVAAAVSGEAGVLIVAPGAATEFLAPLPLTLFPLPGALIETCRALGIRSAADVASRDLEELEARFGPEGVRAHRLVHGLDDSLFRPIDTTPDPEAALELDPPAGTLEPLLFVLRHLLARTCADLVKAGLCAARLELDLRGGREVETAIAVPARPTRRESLLYDLCRAALERAVGSGGRLATPISEVILRVSRMAPPDARQEDLFTRRWRDPMAAVATLSRLGVRLGPGGVVRPAIRADHRPESRSVWEPVALGAAARVAELADRPEASPVPGVLHLLPDPLAVQVRMSGNRPAEIRGAAGHHGILAAEGPERLSGDWWKDPYHREYFRVCTEEGGLLWLFREYRPSDDFRWWLHGWWD